MGIAFENEMGVLAVDHKGQQIHIDHRSRNDDLDLVGRNCKEDPGGNGISGTGKDYSDQGDPLCCIC